MSSNDIYSHTCIDRTPYTYLIGWPYLNLYYYGVRHAKGCHPSDLWVKYFTSSKRVAELRMYAEPDIIEIRTIGTSRQQVLSTESRLLKYVNAAASDNWINGTNGDCNWYADSFSIKRGMHKRSQKYDWSSVVSNNIRKAMENGYKPQRQKGSICSEEGRENHRKARLGKATIRSTETSECLLVPCDTARSMVDTGKWEYAIAKNRTYTDEYRHRASEQMKAMRQANPEPWNKGLKTGPSKLKGLARPRCCCVVCGKEVDDSNLRRWHKHE